MNNLPKFTNPSSSDIRAYRWCLLHVCFIYIHNIKYTFCTAQGHLASEFLQAISCKEAFWQRSILAPGKMDPGEIAPCKMDTCKMDPCKMDPCEIAPYEITYLQKCSIAKVTLVKWIFVRNLF